MQRDYNKAVVGTNTQVKAMIFKTDAPLDDRSAVRSKASLISQTAFGKDKTSDKGWLFNGLIVCDRETGDIYTLYSKDDLQLYTDAQLNNMSEAEIDGHIKSAWRKMATTDQIEQLSGVFQFKGIATSIDPDFTTITVTPLSVNNVSYTCTGYLYDLIHIKYYRWENKDERVKEYYTKENEFPIKVYSKSNGEVTALYVNYKDKIYFPATSSSITEFTSLDGDSIYCSAVTQATPNVPFYTTSTHDAGTGIGNLNVLDYTAYRFIEIDPQPSIQSGSGISIAASLNNQGYVYQIENKEYASNGSIWVELGAPVENNWIIL